MSECKSNGEPEPGKIPHPEKNLSEVFSLLSYAPYVQWTPVMLHPTVWPGDDLLVAWCANDW